MIRDQYGQGRPGYGQPKSIKGEEPKTVKRPAKKKDVERITRDMKARSYKTR